MSNHFTEIKINTDGGSRGNPGQAAVGVMAKSDDQTIFTVSKPIGITTNNVAEYTAVIEALNYLRDQGISAEKIQFILDSELIVKQITGLYQIKQDHLKQLRFEVVELINFLKEKGQIKNLSFLHVKRHLNKEADTLVNQALDSLNK